ncbi:NRDE-2, necessary for RNA interference-domain-containing protein [Crucibulum laeve]|uniref:NRDE-2, necessary for RNA interference-domain-containing protein n=1 Tax=Crucibulum laeve TaxID=68775 RepID=A0A5C3LY93_9AGAR|nr:NRDE-2, necessary for RNA interference-domain-containing protein [Crucibulum laeve]
MAAPPSFSSFPASFSSFPEDDSGPSKSRSDRQKPLHDDQEKTKRVKKGRSKDKERHGEKDQQHRKHDKDRRHRHRSADESRDHADEQRHAAHNVAADSSRFFYSDRRGDHLNIQYGGLHSGDVPKYRLVDGGRSILGLSFSWTAVRRSGKGIEVGLRDRRKMSSLTDSSARALLAAPPTRRMLQTDVSTKYEEVNGFIRLPSRRGPQNAEESYRSITLSKENDSDSGSDSASEDVEEDSSTDDEGPTLSSLQETLKSLEHDITEDPGSVNNWLFLLTHTLSTIPITSKNATKARSEITLSILDRALSAHPRNSSSKLLRIKHLKAGEEIWHDSKLRAEWEDALKVGGVEIWMEWLEWRIRKGSKGLDGIMEDALRAMEAMGAGEEREIERLRIFWRCAVAFRNAGFTERAMAMFQAQAELTFEVPQGLDDLPLKLQLDELEEFWDSELPRVGERGSKGWDDWVRRGKPEVTSTASPASQPSNRPSELDPYRSWAADELRLDQGSVLPARSADDAAQFDPYSMVLFADIRPLLLSLNSAEAKDAFRVAWISAIGLHVPGFSLSSLNTSELDWDDRWSQGYLASSAYLNSIFPRDAGHNLLTADASAGVLIGREKEYSSSFGPVKSWAPGVIEPLDVFPSKPKAWRGMWGEEDVASVDIDFVRRLFVQMRFGNDDSRWDALRLSFEAAISIKGALKQSKELLSLARNSYSHWAAHAQLERMRAHLDDARRVYQTVLVASQPDQKVEVSQLWWNWAEMEWLAGEDEQALNVVLRAVGGDEGRSGMVILRAKRMLEEYVRSVNKRSEWKEREAWIKLRALLELLSGKEVSAMLSIFDEHLSSDSGNVEHESLTVGSVLMVYHYGVTLKRPIPPAILRDRVERALEEYPSNSILLGLFLEGEKGQGLWGRVRGILGESDGRPKSVARRVEEVWIAGWEKGRWAGEVERTRSGLAAAVENERTRASAVIWRIYIEFEIRAGELQRAKKLLFRAIGECPLVKELYLIAFGALRSVFSAHELNGLGDTMVERGMRLRRGLDEVLEGWGGVGLDGEGDRESEESGDEIEHNARELRRLMPY